MSRFIAICEMPGITDEQFRQTFDRVRKWRPDRRTWIVKAYCDLSDGRLVVECEAPERASFEGWLSNTHWKVDGIYGVDLIHEAGAVWPM